jgi:hypothetical protein
MERRPIAVVLKVENNIIYHLSAFFE